MCEKINKLKGRHLEQSKIYKWFAKRCKNNGVKCNPEESMCGAVYCSDLELNNDESYSVVASKEQMEGVDSEKTAEALEKLVEHKRSDS